MNVFIGVCKFTALVCMIAALYYSTKDEYCKATYFIVLALFLSR
jgi:hypothetical protein